jgi:Domain of unknown function (DUF4520)
VAADAAAAAAARVHQPVKSSEIKAKQTVRDLGVFTAFDDGRIRVRFADRTIVAIDRWHRFAEIVHRDGTTVTVSVCYIHDCFIPLYTCGGCHSCSPSMVPSGENAWQPLLSLKTMSWDPAAFHW